MDMDRGFERVVETEKEEQREGDRKQGEDLRKKRVRKEERKISGREIEREREREIHMEIRTYMVEHKTVGLSGKFSLRHPAGPPVSFESTQFSDS